MFSGFCNGLFYMYVPCRVSDMMYRDKSPGLPNSRAGKFSSHQVAELTISFLLTANATDFFVPLLIVYLTSYYGYSSKKSEKTLFDVHVWGTPYSNSRAGKFSSHQIVKSENSLFFFADSKCDRFLCSVTDRISYILLWIFKHKVRKRPFWRACLTMVMRNIDPEPFLNLLRKQNLFPRGKGWRFFFSGRCLEAYAIRHLRVISGNNVSTTMSALSSVGICALSICFQFYCEFRGKKKSKLRFTGLASLIPTSLPYTEVLSYFVGEAF